MKKIYLVILIQCIFLIGKSQNITFASSTSFSTYNKFSSSTGYSIVLTNPVDSSRCIGGMIQHTFNNKFYEVTESSTTDGHTYCRYISPHNQFISMSVFYCYDLLKARSSNLYIGPELSMSYYLINEGIIEHLYNDTDNRYGYDVSDSGINKIGFGMNIDFRTNISKVLRISFSTNPKVIFYKFPAKYMGYNGPVIIGNSGFKKERYWFYL